MSDIAIRPDVRAFLDNIAANPMPTMSDEALAMMRRMPADALPSMDLPVGEIAVMRDLVMRGPGGEIALRLFDPRENRGPSPVVVYYHGGGFVLGSIDTFAALAAQIARELDLPVIAVGYRLAPENPWPAAPDDAEAAARWIAENGAVTGRAPTGLILCGDSAGGNLALVTALALRDRPAAVPAILQIALYPKTDFSRHFASEEQFGSGHFLERADMAFFEAAYAMDAAHWRASPALGNLGGLPPAVVVTAGLDPIRDDGRAFAGRLIAAGVTVGYRNFEGTIHGFAGFRLHLASARQDLSETLTLARAMLAQTG